MKKLWKIYYFKGFSFGANLVLFPSMIAEIYGGENFGKIFGFLQVSSSAASLTVPVIITSIAKHTGTLPTIRYPQFVTYK